jgi:hypothetical protein
MRETRGVMTTDGPSLRDGGPLPRPPFRSFLATAVDPSPNFGGGVVESANPGCFDWLGREMKFSPLRAQFARGGAGGGALADADRCLSQRAGFSPLPRSLRERGRG